MADLSEPVHGEDVLHSQHAAQIFLYGGLAVGGLVVLGAGGQSGQHLPILRAVDVLQEDTHCIFGGVFLYFSMVKECCGTHPWDVGDDLEGDPAAGDVAAVGHPLQQALGETLTIAWRQPSKSGARPGVASEILGH